MNSFRKISVLLITLLSGIYGCTQNFDSTLHYAKAGQPEVIIENSLPRGGLSYTAPDGNVYVYAVFWTKVTNTSNTTQKVDINFTPKAHDIPFTVQTQSTLYIPEQIMKPEKEALFNYGLNVNSFLDLKLGKSSRFNTKIPPKESKAFYVVALFNHGVNGTLRAQMTLDNEALFYTINGARVPCGSLKYWTKKA